MSLKSRIDALSRALSWGELWDGCSMEDIAYYWRDKRAGRCTLDDAAPGVRRILAFVSVQSALRTVLMPENLRRQPGTAQELIDIAQTKAVTTVERLGLSVPVEARVLADRLVTLAVEYGFSDAELKKLKKMIGGKLKVGWSESN